MSNLIAFRLVYGEFVVQFFWFSGILLRCLHYAKSLKIKRIGRIKLACQQLDSTRQKIDVWNRPKTYQAIQIAKPKFHNRGLFHTSIFCRVESNCLQASFWGIICQNIFNFRDFTKMFALCKIPEIQENWTTNSPRTSLHTIRLDTAKDRRMKQAL